MATATPNDLRFRSHAVREIERILPFVEAEAGAVKYRALPHGGIIPAGHANLLRAGYVLLGGDREDIVRAFHEMSLWLAESFAKSRCGSLETFPYAIWPVDNCFALESLRLHDGLYGTDYGAACRRWEAWMAEHLDGESGMMVAQVFPDGVVAAGPRGCALSWSLAVMPNFAPELARSQYARYRSAWFTHRFGMTGIDEWPPGYQGGAMDIDSGPVAFNIGAAASGFGIAAAKANRDWANLGRMLRGLELAGIPTWTLTGRQYFFGKFLLGDQIALWGKTIRRWDAPPEGHAAADAVWDAPPESAKFLLVVVPALLLFGASFLGSLRGVRRAVESVRNNSNRWAPFSRIVFLLDMVAFLLWLFVPCVRWYQLIILAGCLDAVDGRWSRHREAKTSVEEAT